jgi:hypothetical protein
MKSKFVVPIVLVVMAGFGLPAFAGAPKIVVQSPSGGETYVKGRVEPIVLSKYRFKRISVELSRDGGLTYVAIGTIDNTVKDRSKRGRFDWSVGGESSTHCVMRFTGSTGTKKPKVFTAISAIFTIAGDDIVNGGPTGDKGDPGLDASAAAVAAILMADPNFMNAVKGEQGIPGSQGLQGDSGLQGAPGGQGIPGGQGPQGLQGEQGIQGLQGTPGLDANVNDIVNILVGDSLFYITLAQLLEVDQAFLDTLVFMLENDPLFINKVVEILKNDPEFIAQLKGEKGDKGEQGPAGQDGLDADPAEVANILKNDNGFLAATKGDQGIQGIQGVAGPAGQDADPAEVAGILKDDPEFITATKGDQGIQGVQGVAGPAGQDADPTEVAGILKDDPAFVAATKGEQGEQGEQGIPGVQGPVGPAGQDADPADVAVILKNDPEFVAATKGEKGEPGSQGPIGPNGPTVSYISTASTTAAVLSSSKHDGYIVFNDPNIRGSGHEKGRSKIFLSFSTTAAASGVIGVSYSGLVDGQITINISAQNYAIQNTDSVDVHIINAQ